MQQRDKPAVSPRQGHCATGLHLCFPPYSFPSCIVSALSSGLCRAIPSSRVPNTHQSATPFPIFLPSFLKTRTHRIGLPPTVQIGCPSEAVGLFRFAASPFSPFYPCSFLVAFGNSIHNCSAPTGLPWAFHPKCLASFIHTNTTTSPCPTAAHVPRANSAGKSFRTLLTGQQSTS